MSPRKLLVVALAMTALGAVAPASAAAFPPLQHPSPNGLCNVRMFLAPRIISAGEPLLIWGKLTCRRPASAADKEVKLYEHVHGTPGFTYVQSVMTNTNGYYEIEKADGTITTNRWFLVRSHGASSGAKPLRVEAEVTLAGPPEGTQLYTGRANAVTFTGTVNPADEGALVVLQRQNAVTGNEWHSIGRGTVETNGTFTIIHVFRYPGDADIRVLVLRTDDRNIPSSSNVLTYEISQAQNPDLTINSSADPITFGQQVTISGTVANAKEQPVTLYGRTVGQQFAPIAQATTNNEGDYTFPAQAPMNSTFYRVESTTKHSAVLFEGVRYLLTTSVSQTTVQAGQPVTFSGAVEPGHEGGIVYLERKDANGPGYHVIQVATIGSGSTYTIEHRFYDAGTKTIRIYVPGGPENSAAASTPFAIEVTPAPASALAPEMGPNITLPSEGQVKGASGEETASGGLEAEPGESESTAGTGTPAKVKGKKSPTTTTPEPTTTPTPTTTPEESETVKHHRRGKR